MAKTKILAKFGEDPVKLTTTSTEAAPLRPLKIDYDVKEKTSFLFLSSGPNFYYYQ